MQTDSRNRQPQPLDLDIEKLVPGGDGLARHEGKVYFVPMTLPGEKVRVRVTESKKDFARAEVAEILAPSPDRVKPECAVFGRCGGCDWQHIGYPAQLLQKVAMVEDALRRTGGLVFPGLAIEAGKPWRYRNRIQIHRGPGGEGGFLARDSHAVIPIATCPVSASAFDTLLATPATPGQPVQGMADKRLQGRRYSAWSHSRPDGSDFLISDEPGATGPGLVLAPGLPAAPVPGYLGPRVEGTSGEIEAVILGKVLRFDLRCFFQSNLAMAEKLVRYALDGLAGEEALDLYCGVGLFGAFLTDTFTRVLAVEENPISLEYALRNIGATQHFLRGRVEDLLGEERGYLAACRPDVVVVDPPRDGLDQAVKDFLIAKKPPRLIYVACNPVTLARDLKTLIAAGFRLDALRLFDFYPQTAHVEAVAKLAWLPIRRD
jgi:23S rRNA (uracil1939-C5)-methyltransferase